MSLTRIVNVPARGIGDTSVKLMQAHAVAPAFALASHAASGTDARIFTRAVNSAANFVRLMESCRTGPDGVHKRSGHSWKTSCAAAGIEHAPKKWTPTEEEHWPTSRN